MKEGMVLEVHNKYVVVLTSSGEFLKLRKKGNVNIGDVYKGRPYVKFPYYYAAAASIMLIIISTYTGITAYANQIVGFVDINGDKNIRLYINRKGTIQRIEGLKNAEKFKGLTLDEAAQKIEDAGIEEGALSSNSKPVISSTQLKDSDVDINNIRDRLEKAINNKNKDNNIKQFKEDEQKHENNEKSNINHKNEDKSEKNSNNNSSSNENSVNKKALRETNYNSDETQTYDAKKDNGNKSKEKDSESKKDKENNSKQHNKK